MPAGRPTEYTPELLEKAYEYLKTCVDTEEDKENGIKQKVKIPSKGGLAVALNVSRDSLYEWAKNHKEFSDIMEQMSSIQEERLLNKGLSGDYNPTIAKVLLTKHGYREGIEQTGKEGKDLFPKVTPEEKEKMDGLL